MPNEELARVAHDMRYAWDVIRPRCDEIAVEMGKCVNRPWRWRRFWQLDREVSRLHREWRAILDRSEVYVDRHRS